MIAGVVTFSESGIAVIGVLLSSLVGAIITIFKLLMKAKDDQLADKEALCKSYRSMLLEATTILDRGVNKVRADKGLPPFEALAAVIPEHSSPVSPRQREAAEVATFRAQLVAAAKELDVTLPGNDELEKIAAGPLAAPIRVEVVNIQPVPVVDVTDPKPKAEA